MGTRRRKYDKEFKMEAVHLATKGTEKDHNDIKVVSKEMKTRIISNIHTLNTVQLQGLEIELCKYPHTNSSIITIFTYFIKSFKFDYILLNCATTDLMVLALLKLYCPFNKCKLISLDAILRVPVGLRDRMTQKLKQIAFRKVHMFLQYFRNTEGYQRYFHIRPDQFQYVPFKVNSYEMITKTKISDEGYIFCGGRSLRDFSSLIEAVRGLEYPVRIITEPNATIEKHGSYLDENNLPMNVEVIRHDGNQETFIQHIAASRLAVIPLKKHTIAAAGISVYLMCMGLKKCTIISDLPGVGDVLGKDKAIIVPPENVQALKQAIVKAYEDSDYRNRIAENGYNYAIKLKGEDRLKESIVKEIYRDFVKQ